MHTLVIGSEQSDHLAMRFAVPARRNHDWVDVDVTIAAEAFRGRIKIICELVDLLDFERELQQLYKSLNGRAEFKHRDNQLYFSVKGNGRGGIELEGQAYARPTWGSKLEFEIALDQTYLVEPLAVLKHVRGEAEVDA